MTHDQQPAEVTVQITWTEVGAVRAEPDRTVRLPAMPDGGGLYRFRLSLGDRGRIYVGEAEQYRRRFRHYQSPGRTQYTNVRMLDRLVVLLHDHGGTATIDVADVRLHVAGNESTLDELPGPFARRLAENAAIVHALASGLEIINGAGHPPGELWP